MSASHPLGPLLLAGWLAAAPALATPVLEGRLLDGPSGRPVAGAELRVRESGQRVVTDRDGQWVLHDLAPGCWRLESSHLAYHSLDLEVCLDGAGCPVLDLRLEPRVLELPEARVVAGRESLGVESLGRGRSRLALDNSPGQDLAGLLERLPGVAVIHEGGPGAPATVSVDGCAPREVLVCIDGVPLNPGGDRAVDLGRLDPGPLAAVELKRGADPARGALAGVLNLVTRQGATPRQRLDGETGRPGGRSLALGLQGPAGASLLDGSLRLQQGDGQYVYTDPQDGSERTRRNTDFRREALSLGWQPGGGPVSRLALAAHRREAGIGDRIDLSDPWPLRERERNLGLQLHGRPGRLRDGRLWLHEDRRHTTGWPWGGVTERERTLGLEGTLPVGTPARGTLFRLGLRSLSYRAEQGGRPGTGTRHEARPVFGLERPRLALDAGAQLWHDGHAPEAVPVALVDWQPLPDLPLARGTGVVRLAASLAPRLPSFMERFPVGGAQVQGNPDLRPELHRELRLGLEYHTGPAAGGEAGTGSRALRAGLELLGRDSRHLIVWRQSQASAWKPFNLGHSRLVQLQGRLDLAPVPGWLLAGEVHLRDPRNRTPGINRGRYLPHVPLHAWNTRLEWRSRPEGVLVALTAQGAGRSYSGESNLEGLDGAALDPWWMLGARLVLEGRRGRTDWAASLELENLLDAQVRQISKVPLPGRAFRLGFRLGVEGEVRE